MKRSIILELLRDRQDAIVERFRVTKLALFGSAARDELREQCDIDVLIAFDGPAPFDRYFDLKTYLEAFLGRAVDLVTEKGLKPRARSMSRRT